MFKSSTNGFSLIEFVITTTILTILSLLTSAAVHHLKESNRNAMRVGDIVEIQTALVMYNRLANQYPATLTMGDSLTYDGQVLLDPIPTNIEPYDDGDCPNDDYQYEAINNQQSYNLTFCISTKVGDIGPGINTATPNEISSCLPNCVMSCGDGSDGCGGICNNIKVCPSGYTCHFDHCIKDY